MRPKKGIQESGVRSQEKRIKFPGSWILAPGFHKSLLAWYHKHKRDLPWRRTKDPYKIWISEIMLQQTQVATVINYYHRFLKRFPDLASLASAKEEEVLAHWSGLGYYSRAKNLHRAAQMIVQGHGERFPEDPELIGALPGIGRYTLGAIASIAFNLPLPLVDGNVIRVYSRLFALEGYPKEARFQKKMWEIAEEIIGRLGGHYGDFNQALMELGATVCTPMGPLCPICPIKKLCKGQRSNPEQFPERKAGPQTKILKRIAAILEKDGKILLQKSDDHRWMKGLWQIPSLFSENGDPLHRLLSRLAGQLGFSPKTAESLPELFHAVTHHRITIYPFLFKQARGRLISHPSIERRWFSATEIAAIGLPAADRKILSRLVS